ncbi:MAG TPA: tetratricopeptide repeat protein [Candidatus Dormibacteraeota bacterium]|nr:tetratricopeptide repeat protein [Candidatus Dormibacteraeota bacterium]
MTEGQTPTTGNWTSTQAYVISVVCLLLGVAIGYLARGSASTQAAAGAPSQPTATIPAAGGSGAVPAMQTPTPEQLKQMADAQAEPLLAQLKSNPNDPDLLYKIGNLYYDAQQYPEAVTYYEGCLKINPKQTDVRTDMATAYHFMGQTDRALREYDEVLKIDSKHANALFNKGMVEWQDKQDMSGAVASWKQLLASNPTYPDRERVQGLIAQAEQHLSMKSGAPGKASDKAN